MKVEHRFTVKEWEVSFLQDDVVTVCVVRNMKKLDERYTGISVRNPRDKFDAAVGRHKALKTCIEENQSKMTQMAYAMISLDRLSRGLRMLRESACRFPASEIQKAYWEHYQKIEKGK
jgi:hypothetical protein